jgi:ferritin-like metal-binding protein YciE
MPGSTGASKIRRERHDPSRNQCLGLGLQDWAGSHRRPKLEDPFLMTLKNFYHAEKQILKALPKMVTHAASAKLEVALEHHLKETEGQVERVERVFKLMGKQARGEACEAIEGVIEEGDEVIEKFKNAAVCDAGMIAAGQAIEHCGIARYGTLIAWTNQTGMTKAAKLLEQTLEQDKMTSRKLNEIALDEVNRKAA